jgi:hypothetical protein
MVLIGYLFIKIILYSFVRGNNSIYMSITIFEDSFYASVEDIRKPCVYYLKLKNKIVYIGYTDCFFDRIGTHLSSDKVFDSFNCKFFITALEAMEYEVQEIKKHNPIYNKAHSKYTVKKDILIIKETCVQLSLNRLNYTATIKFEGNKYRAETDNIKLSYTLVKGCYKGAILIKQANRIYYFSGYKPRLRLRLYK